ncbi:MAG: DEAD/DEAH box helicase [Clostridiales bacterium]|nr:DEAD/DEAH box helicase [Clostridiales bacterium]
MEGVIRALSTLRTAMAQDEYDLHALIARVLQENEIPFVHEAPLAPRCRIDFLCGRTGIEVKRGRPNSQTLRKQAEKYLASPLLDDLVVVTERAANLPGRLAGKPVTVLSLNGLWGVADPAGDALSGPQGQENGCVHTDETAKMTDAGGTHGDSRKSAMNDHAPAVQTETDAPARWQTLVTRPDAPTEEGATSATASDALVPEPPFGGEGQVEDRLLAAALWDDLPVYLRPAERAGVTYGTLSYNARREQWVIKGEPCVTELAKRLFPGSAGARRGEARFTAHRRLIGDVNWLMQRYPLTVAPRDRERFEASLAQARQYYRQRERARIAPPVCHPGEDVFCGELRPFQQEGVAFLNMTDRALLADEMGLGKTVQALCSAAMRGLFPLCVVAPPHLVLNWKRETERFVRIGGRPPRVHVVKGLTPYPLPEADVYLVHYLLLRGWKEALPKAGFRGVIFDEIQELRRSGTDKYSAASLLSESCGTVIGLSGTPIYNHGGEIWNVVNILDFHFLGDWESFSREWCAGYGNNIVLKPDLLGEHLRREGLMLRRTKAQVLPELPAKRRLVQQIDADDKIYRQLMAPVAEKLNRWRDDRSLTPSARALLEDQISQGERQATGVAKAPYVCQFVRALIENGEKVLLFAHHHAVMDLYKKELSGLHPVFITGRETDGQKQTAADRFMNGKTELCCVSLRAASGLNLQRATCVVFGEMDWSPAVHAQAEDRAHRMGHKDSLLCYYLVSPRGSDADMQEALGLKVSQFVGLMGDRPLSQERQQTDAAIARTHVERLLSRMAAEEDARNGKNAGCRKNT